MKRLVGLGLAITVSVAFVFATESRAAFQSKAPEFEVATIKPYQVDPNARGMFSGGSCHGVDKQYPSGSPIAPPPLRRCVFSAVSLYSLIAISYKMPAAGGPAWASSDRFNVEGKAEDSSMATEADLLAMLQTLVTSRFNLQFHREQRDVQGFSLVVGKNGLRIKEANCDTPPRTSFGPGARVTAECVTMSFFAMGIRGMAGGPVTDKTGLTAKYTFTFEWPTGDPGAFLSEMQAELGLRVESMKIPTEYLIFDRAEKPQP